MVTDYKAVFDLVSDGKLKELAKDYKDNPKATELIRGILEVRKAEQERVKVEKQWEAEVAQIHSPPNPTLQRWLHWCEMEIPVGEPEAVIGVDGNPTEVMRQSMGKVWRWKEEAGRVTSIPTGRMKVGGGETNAGTLYKRSGLALERINHFPSGSAACAFLKLDPGKGSAVKKLVDLGYHWERDIDS